MRHGLQTSKRATLAWHTLNIEMVNLPVFLHSRSYGGKPNKHVRNSARKNKLVLVNFRFSLAESNQTVIREKTIDKY